MRTEDEGREVMLTDREARNAAYRAGYCADCGERPYSAGRPRCEDCHTTYIELRAAGGAP